LLKLNVKIHVSEASITWVNDAEIFMAFSDGEEKKCLAHETSAQFLCIEATT